MTSSCERHLAKTQTQKNFLSNQWIEIPNFYLTEISLKMTSLQCQLFCLGSNVVTGPELISFREKLVTLAKVLIAIRRWYRLLAETAGVADLKRCWYVENARGQSPGVFWYVNVLPGAGGPCSPDMDIVANVFAKLLGSLSYISGTPFTNMVYDC